VVVVVVVGQEAAAAQRHQRRRRWASRREKKKSVFFEEALPFCRRHSESKASKSWFVSSGGAKRGQTPRDTRAKGRRAHTPIFIIMTHPTTTHFFLFARGKGKDLLAAYRFATYSYAYL
jgi:hypothetical protein